MSNDKGAAKVDPAFKAKWARAAMLYCMVIHGYIHLRCPDCGKEAFNYPRGPFDPPDAALAELPCGECCTRTGAKEPGISYFNEMGREIINLQEQARYKPGQERE